MSKKTDLHMQVSPKDDQQHVNESSRALLNSGKSCREEE